MGWEESLRRDLETWELGESGLQRYLNVTWFLEGIAWDSQYSKKSKICSIRGALDVLVNGAFRLRRSSQAAQALADWLIGT